MKMEEVAIPNETEFSHQLPEGTKVLGVLNPLAMKIGVALPTEKPDQQNARYNFVACKTGDFVSDTAKYLGSIGHGTTHIFFLPDKR